MEVNFCMELTTLLSWQQPINNTQGRMALQHIYIMQVIEKSIHSSSWSVPLSSMPIITAYFLVQRILFTISDLQN